MLFTLPVLREKWDEIPAVLHHDNTTRPQSVCREHTRLYYQMIEKFEKLTRVPMVLNTSFNTAFEPIVDSPEDAISSFLQLGADYLAIGGCLVDAAAVGRRVAVSTVSKPSEIMQPDEPARPRQPRAGRLMLRLTTRCNNRCAHCTVADIAHHPDKAPKQALAEIIAAKKTGCRELVFMRGEPTLRKDLVPLSRRARDMGYSVIQLQTNGRVLSYEKYLRMFLDAGINFFEVSLYGHTPALHNLVARAEGAFEQTAAGIRNLARLSCDFLVNVPVVKANYTVLSEIAAFVHDAGARRIQFNFTRPVRIGKRWNVSPLVRLDDASVWIRSAIDKALELGMAPGTEAVPLCHLAPHQRDTAGETGDFSRFQAADLHRKASSLGEHRESARPRADECKGCSLASRCPTTWAAYQRLYGTFELRSL